MTDQDAGDIILAAKNGDFGTHFSFILDSICMDNYNFVSYKTVLYTIPYSTTALSRPPTQ